ncbi:MAG: hypothetical protein JST68_04135 [Bacteroidetes bacterium]|nr:hypothetical protein [Bacteroidota bacterium]
MSGKKVILSLNEMLKGHTPMSGEVVAGFNQRIKERMKGSVRDYQKKQQTSLEKVSRTILNA